LGAVEASYYTRKKEIVQKIGLGIHLKNYIILKEIKLKILFS